MHRKMPDDAVTVNRFLSGKYYTTLYVLFVFPWMTNGVGLGYDSDGGMDPLGRIGSKDKDLIIHGLVTIDSNAEYISLLLMGRAADPDQLTLY